ncbi:MAG: hypothetical protein LBK62_10480 [Treponema sp.]|jgi:hypothetical protein|nr:hypothetical protein [Treponema sp.]
MKISKETFRSPQAIFIIYIAAASLLIMGFRFIFPGEAAPLPIYSRNWRYIRGVLDIFTVFPALAMSALVAPFGLAVYEDYHSGFSPQFFKRLFVPIIIAICAAALYGVIFFLALPVARDREENMRYSGELYRLAKERAQTHSRAGEWLEASQFIGICDRVWPNSPELTTLRTEINVRLDENRFEEEDERAAARAELADDTQSAAMTSLPGRRQPLDTADAIGQGEAAFNERRYFDAHWFATLGERLARAGSPEAVTAARLAARAWNQIESQQPSFREERLYSLYRLKQSGYEAMVSGDWIRAYYLFQELQKQTPDDPDVVNFLAACEKGTTEIAFFIDEIEVSLGAILTGAVFSLPSGAAGRAVLRFSSLSASPDFAYGIGLEYMSFDAQSRPLFHLEAPYAKLLPFTVDDRRQVLVLMRALARYDQNLRWEPEWILEGTAARSSAGDAQIILDMSYETFILLSQIRQGLPNLQIGELFDASKMIGAVGYVPQVFEAEILNRLGTVLFFLPMSIAAIIIGWRFRAKSRVRYLFIPLLPLLPIVFNGMTHLYRSVLNILGIWLITALGFSMALVVFIVALAVSFILSLIVLAAQHG